MSPIEPHNNDDWTPGHNIISSMNYTSATDHSLSQSKSGDEKALTAVGFTGSSFPVNEGQITINNSLTGGSTEGYLADIGWGDLSVDGELPMEKDDPSSNRLQFSKW